MLKPIVKVKEFEKFGFKKCKGEYGKSGCYYLCVARGCKMIFVSDVYFAVSDWKDNDPRIHKNANCKYSDDRTADDILYELIIAGMIKSEFATHNEVSIQNIDEVIDDLKYMISEECTDTQHDYVSEIEIAIKSMKKLKEYQQLESHLQDIFSGDISLDTVVNSLEQQISDPKKKHPVNARILTYEDADKWNEYNQLEKQGRLLELPFKTGDTVYELIQGFIEPCTVEVIFLANYVDNDGNHCNMAEIRYDREDCPYVSTEIYFTDIGKTIFLTKSEAEAKLKEMRY